MESDYEKHMRQYNEKRIQEELRKRRREDNILAAIAGISVFIAIIIAKYISFALGVH